MHARVALLRDSQFVTAILHVYYFSMYPKRFCGNVAFAFNILLKYSLLENARNSVASVLLFAFVTWL